MARNYRKEYDNYHSRPEQKVRRAARNAARRLFADADPDKDVHHKDNNPLNNDKKNLSLVTQHYNRREPRLREDAAAAADLKAKQAAEVDALKSKQEGETEAQKAKHEREGERQKKMDDAEAESEKARASREHVELDEANYKIKNGKLYISKKDYVKKPKEYKGKRKGKPTLMALDPKTGSTTSFEVVFEEFELDEVPLIVSNEVSAIKVISDKFEKLLTKSNFKKKQKLAKAVGITVTMRGKHSVSVEQDEEAGTVTGPHIVGTGDDSSTVVVKKKKKKQVYRRESLKKKIIDNILAKTHNKNGGIK